MSEHLDEARRIYEAAMTSVGPRSNFVQDLACAQFLVLLHIAERMPEPAPRRRTFSDEIYAVFIQPFADLAELVIKSCRTKHREDHP